jgi:adenosine deaminase
MDQIRSFDRTAQYTLQKGKELKEEPSSPVPQDCIELSQEKARAVEGNQALLEKTVKSLPKVDIHRHLEGAIKPETVLAIAEKYGIELPANTLEELKPHVCFNSNDKSLLDFLKKFTVLSKLFVNTDAIREISTQCVRDAKEENVRAMELRFSPVSMAKAGNLDFRNVVDAIIEGVREGERETGITVSLTTIIPRNKGPQLGKELEILTRDYVEKGRLNYNLENPDESVTLPSVFSQVTAIDLANDEANFPADPYAPVFQESKADGVHRTLHAGEARGAESVRTAIEHCNAERIGHGIRAFEDPALVEMIIKGGIPLEMCPTSNVQTGAVDSLANHPLKKFYDMGGKATINTDDPGVCDTDLNKEFMKAITGIGCSLRDVENMTVFAIDAMFLPAPIKAALRSSIIADINRVNRNL